MFKSRDIQTILRILIPHLHFKRNNIIIFYLWIVEKLNLHFTESLKRDNIDVIYSRMLEEHFLGLYQHHDMFQSRDIEPAPKIDPLPTCTFSKITRG